MMLYHRIFHREVAPKKYYYYHIRDNNRNTFRVAAILQHHASHTPLPPHHHNTPHIMHYNSTSNNVQNRYIRKTLFLLSLAWAKTQVVLGSQVEEAGAIAGRQHIKRATSRCQSPFDPIVVDKLLQAGASLRSQQQARLNQISRLVFLMFGNGEVGGGHEVC